MLSGSSVACISVCISDDFSVNSINPTKSFLNNLQSFEIYLQCFDNDRTLTISIVNTSSQKGLFFMEPNKLSFIRGSYSFKVSTFAPILNT